MGELRLGLRRFRRAPHGTDSAIRVGMNAIKTYAVLAGAYRGGRTSLLRMRTHAAEIDAAGYAVRVLCDGIDVDSLAGEADPSETSPMCPRCAAKMARAAK